MSLWSAWAVALFASVQALFAYGPHASGVKIYSLTDLSLLGDTMTTLFGQATLARVLLLLLFSLVLITIDRRSQRWWRVSAVALAVAIAGSMSAVGHPSNQSPVGLSVALDMMHLLAVSMWVGGLFLITIDRKFWLRSTQSMLWFSRIAGYSVVVLAVTGIGQTMLLLDGFGDVFTIDFGQKLSVKVLLVAALVALGGLSRKTLHAAGPAKLHQSVLVESLVALIIVGITALLVALPPNAQASLIPFETTLTQSGLIATITVTPARVGTTEIHVSISSLDGTFVQAQSITGRVGLPERSLPSGPISFEKTGPNHYTAIVSFAFAGEWDLDLLVKPTDTTTVLFSTDIAIKE
jgi:copper transport protein